MGLVLSCTLGEGKLVQTFGAQFGIIYRKIKCAHLVTTSPVGHLFCRFVCSCTARCTYKDASAEALVRGEHQTQWKYLSIGKG